MSCYKLIVYDNLITIGNADYIALLTHIEPKGQIEINISTYL